jgi:hypothetical protein
VDRCDSGSITKYRDQRDGLRSLQRRRRSTAPDLCPGAGLNFDNHTDVGPRSGEESAWTGPYVEYGEAHCLPLDSQTAAGTSLDLLWDNRDSFINADHGWLAKASYRSLFDGFLGGDSSWQKLNLHLRLREPLE